jgi:hypothetical protein
MTGELVRQPIISAPCPKTCFYPLQTLASRASVSRSVYPWFGGRWAVNCCGNAPTVDRICRNVRRDKKSWRSKSGSYVRVLRFKLETAFLIDDVAIRKGLVTRHDLDIDMLIISFLSASQSLFLSMACSADSLRRSL